MFFKILLKYFFAVLSISAAIQFLIIPNLFPILSDEDGLLYGIDSIQFHNVAVEQANRIKEFGWSEWELKPRGWAPSGIASAIYSLIIPKPWVLLPLNSFLHAFAATLLTIIIFNFIHDKKNAIISTLPFLFFPSCYLWVAQIHKDSLFIAGIMLSIFSIDYFASMAQKLNFKLNKSIHYAIISILGSIIVWVVRPYALDVILFYQVVFSLVMIVFLYKDYIIHKNIKTDILILVILITVLLLLKIGTAFKYSEEQENTKTNPSLIEPLNWEWKDYIPDLIEKKLYQISKVRKKYIQNYYYSGTLVDENYNITNIYDFLKYTPRAIQIGLFSPFPLYWFDKGYKEAGEAMRLFSAFEMCIVYICLMFFFLCSIAIWKKNIQFWAIIIFCIGFIAIYTFSIPNIGTLYRMRFSFLQTLMALGLAGFFVCIKHQRNKLEKIKMID